MRRVVVALVSLGIVLVIALLLALTRMIPVGYLPGPANTPVFCMSMPFYDPGQFVVVPTIYPQTAGPKVKFAAVIDLDPTIPEDSKATVLIRRLDGEYEYAFYATQEQREGYLKSLHIGDCLVNDISPACLAGHFPGEPPGRRPCTLPTPKAAAK